VTRRHETLVPLTHDHHHALAQARRLRELEADDTTGVRRAADDFINFYLGRARHHFREEEELFFPPVVDDERARECVTRAVTEHLRLHAHVNRLRQQLSRGDIEVGLLTSIAELLASHIRFEEQELFPLIEDLIPEDDLLHLATAGRRDV
jgi:hemerythrin-like domain-containing protein